MIRHSRSKNIDHDKIEDVAKEIHWYISYGMLSMYYMIMNTIKSKPDSEEREEKSKIVDQLLNLSQSLYEELADEQKELYHQLAQKMINIVEKSNIKYRQDIE